MKKNILNTLLLGASALMIGGLASCEDYLTIYPTGSITKEDYWNTSNDVDNVRSAAYYQLTQQIDMIVIWGEFRSDNVTLNKMDQTRYLRLQEAVLQPNENMFDWAGFYKGINYCNEVLDNGQYMVDNDVDPSFQQGDWAPVKAEMTALRALNYFYLVRAFRDVPYVKHSVSTDAEAKASRIDVTPGYVILEDLIKDVEEVRDVAARNYGNSTDNKGRWTSYNMSALLADMYLWRAALIKGISQKTDAAGNPYPFEGNEKEEVIKCLNKVIENCDIVIKYQQDEYKKSLDRLNVPAEDLRRKLEFPLAQNDKDINRDQAYDAVFGSKNGAESVFELQFDGSNNKNRFYNTYFYGNGSGSYSAGVMVANQMLCNNMTKTYNDKGYGKLDYRYLSYLLYEKPGQAAFPIIKNVAGSIYVGKAEDVTLGYDNAPTFRNNSSMSANWPVYRLTDVMLMKSEAIARLLDGSISAGADKALGFHMVNAIFRRNNPAADSINTASPQYVERLNPNISDNVSWADQSGRTANELLTYTMGERQREFLGEGKRWFDLVRECEWRGATADVLSDWMSAPNSVKNRCRSLWSLYNPIYMDEMKVNGVGYGDGNGKLHQNPIWEKYMID